MLRCVDTYPMELGIRIAHELYTTLNRHMAVMAVKGLINVRTYAY